jgi:TonB family protein
MSTGPTNRHRNRRRESLALLLSLLIHVLVALLFLIWPFEKERLGSEELDIDLVAPRLAPPIATLGGVDLPARARLALGAKRDRRASRGGESDGRDRARKARERAARHAQAREAAQQALPPWLIPLPRQRPESGARPPKRSADATEASEPREQRKSEQRKSEQRKSEQRKSEQQKQKQKQKRGQKGQRQEAVQGEEHLRARSVQGDAGHLENEREKRDGKNAREERDRAATDASKSHPRRAAPEPKLAVLTSAAAVMRGSALFRPDRAARPCRPAAAPEMLPEGPSLSALVDTVRQEARLRERARQRALDRSRRRDADADAALTAVRQRTERAARGLDRGGSDASVAGRGHLHGAPGLVGGRAQRLGMKFYLSGRRVKTSRVVRPPELIRVPAIQCKVRNPGVTPATVRMLVETSGKVGHLYLKHSSGSKRFDRCALSHTRRMFFKPGTDQAGAPLNVWINVRVEPSLLAGL